MKIDYFDEFSVVVIKSQNRLDYALNYCVEYREFSLEQTSNTLDKRCSVPFVTLVNINVQVFIKLHIQRQIQISKAIAK